MLMILKPLLTLLSFKGLRKMEEKVENKVNSNGSGKKLGMGWKIGLMALLAILVISPLDAVPDLVPVVGWVDDVAYVAGILGTIVGMLKGRRADQLTSGSGAKGYIPPMYNEVKSNKKR
jgi:Uncharacterized conserved protein